LQDDQRSTDPILDRASERPLAEDPPIKELVKGESLASTGGPKAGRSTLDEAKRRGVIGYLQLLGPGLITGASDDDPSGIGTYTQVGSQFGLGLLWTALFTFPLMVAVQELCARIALQTGVGLGVSLRRKFSAWIVGPAILAMLIANTINLGADLGAVAAGGSLLTGGFISTIWLIIPAAALVLGFQLFTTYAVIFKAFKYLTLALFAYVITTFIVRPDLASVVGATFVPHMQLSSDFITALVAVLGTTISPYLFFWQASAEVDEMKAGGMVGERQRKGTTRGELKAARFDILVGMFFSQVVMYCIILTSGTVLNGNGRSAVQTSQDAAQALAPLAGQFAFVLFAVGLIGTGLLAIPILSGSAAYAVKEFVGFKGGLAVKPRYRPTFYAIIVVATLIGAAMNYAHLDPIKALFITAVINGLVAPPLLVLIVLLGSDRRVMNERISGWLSRSLGWAAAGLMGLAAAALLYFDFISH
jgi:NRAMP (natural resistance-associated macrophage protein)-like metal ion transporter